MSMIFCRALTSSDVMQEIISKSKSFIKSREELSAFVPISKVFKNQGQEILDKRLKIVLERPTTSEALKQTQLTKRDLLQSLKNLENLKSKSIIKRSTGAVGVMEFIFSYMVLGVMMVATGIILKFFYMKLHNETVDF
jgi:hypothetical protein